MADALAAFAAPSVDDQRILPVLSVICEPGATRNGGYDHLSDRFDAHRALLAAVGHPLLTVRRQGGNGVAEFPLEWVVGAPVLSVVRRHQDIPVTVEPFPPDGRSLLPVDETPKRVRLFQFEPAHREACESRLCCSGVRLSALPGTEPVGVADERSDE